MHFSPSSFLHLHTPTHLDQRSAHLSGSFSTGLEPALPLLAEILCNHGVNGITLNYRNEVRIRERKRNRQKTPLRKTKPPETEFARDSLLLTNNLSASSAYKTMASAAAKCSRLRRTQTIGVSKSPHKHEFDDKRQDEKKINASRKKLQQLRRLSDEMAAGDNVRQKKQKWKARKLRTTSKRRIY